MKVKKNILIFLGKILIRKNEYDHPSFFIISSGRSGTTLLRKLLVNSKQVHIPPESNDWIPAIAIVFTKYFYKSWEFKIEKSISILQTDPSFTFWKIDIEKFKKELRSIPSKEQTFYSFINKLYTFNIDKPDYIIGDKTPYLVLELSWLKAIFPNAKYIHLLRDSRDVISSRMENFNESIEQATNRWVWALEETEKHFKPGSKNFMELKYEDLVSDSINTLKSVTEFLDIKFTDEIFQDEGLNLGDTHLEHHKEISNPINSNALQKWKGKLTEAEVQYINKKTNPWLIKKGYD
jgi:protein-tyrosine sulfotransferase